MRLIYRFSHILQGSTDFSFSTHRFWIVLNGTGEISYSDGTIFLSNQDVLEIPPGIPFTLNCITQMQLGIVEVTDFRPGSKTLQKRSSTETELIRKTFFFAVDYSGFEHKYSDNLRFLLDTLVYETLTKTALKEFKINPQVARFLDEVNQHLYEPDYDIQPLIEATGYSKSHFHKIFHEATGLSPVEYIHVNRIEHAKCLLTQTQAYSVKEVATLCGYNDVYYFSKIFRRKTGLSPSQFANR